MTPLVELQLLPPVSYFSMLAAHGRVRLEGCENFQKSTFRNRYRLATSRGPMELSVPLRGGKNRQCPIREVEISYDENWPLVHWRSIETTYRSAPFWLHFADHFEPIFLQKRWQRLWDFNFCLLKKSLQLLDLQVAIEISDDFRPFQNPPEPADFRNQFSAKNADRPAPFQPVKYPQLFEDRLGFLPDLSIFDLLFCQGKVGREVLKKSWRAA